MNQTTINSDLIAALLSSSILRLSQSGKLGDYLSLTFGRRVSDAPVYDSLIVLEGSDGNVPTGVIHTFTVANRWISNLNGCRNVSFGDLPNWWDDHNEASTADRPFYRQPLLMFLWSGNQITFGEHVGPNLICRKLGKLHCDAYTLRIVDVQVLWISYLANAPPKPQGIVQELSLEMSL